LVAIWAALAAIEEVGCDDTSATDSFIDAQTLASPDFDDVVGAGSPVRCDDKMHVPVSVLRRIRLGPRWDQKEGFVLRSSFLVRPCGSDQAEMAVVTPQPGGDLLDGGTRASCR
jgi:hypothetical protein